MSNIKIPAGYYADIKRIEAAGFTHIKIELEAELNRSGDYEDDDYCENEIRSFLSRETVEALNYTLFYSDGSVDSELTFTLPIHEAWRSVEIMGAFAHLANDNGYGIRTERAGLHITLMTESGYPTNHALNAAKLANFTTQVTKLLPALYAAASHDGMTRGFQYRTPQISPTKRSVYPAICTHNGTCLEYRLFDTCYDRPEALLEKIQIIAATVEYFSTKKVSLTARNFVLDRVTADNAAKEPFRRTIKDKANLRALKETVALIKPRGVSLRAFLASRNLNLTEKEVVHFQKALDLHLSLKYQTYVDSYLAQVHDHLREWLQTNRPEISKMADVKAVMPIFNDWFRGAVRTQGIEPTPFKEWARSQSPIALYKHVLKTFELTEPVVVRDPQQIMVNDLIASRGMSNWQF